MTDQLPEQRPEEKIVWAVSPSKDMLIIGVPEAGWAYMKDTRCHTLDLTKVGVPIRVMLFGGKDREEILRLLKPHMTPDVLDMSGLDMGFDDPEAPRVKLTVKDARERRCCRLCGIPVRVSKGVGNGWALRFARVMTTDYKDVQLDYGKEFAHRECLEKEKSGD